MPTIEFSLETKVSKRLRVLRSLVKTARNNKGNNSVREENRVCAVGKNKYEEEKDIFVEGKVNKFVLM